MAMLCLVCGRVGAQTYNWDPEAPAAGQYYIYSVGQEAFLDVSNTLKDVSENPTCWNLTANESNWNIGDGNGKYVRVYHTGSWFSIEYHAVANYKDAVPTKLNQTANGGENTFNLESVQDAGRYFKANSKTSFENVGLVAAATAGENVYFQLFSKAQWDDEIARQAKIAKYDIITPYDGEQGIWSDVSGYIKNANVIQSYSDNKKRPFGWQAYKHGSGNGTYTLGTGDTKLECWHGTAASFDVDYYQIITLPKGKYRLSADVLFRGTENAIALYVSQQDAENQTTTLVDVSGETYNNYKVEFEVTAEAQYSIGVKKVGTNSADNAWMAADNFKLEYWKQADSSANLVIKDGYSYGTFVAPFEVTLKNGVKAYTVGDYNKEAKTIAMSEVLGGVIPANTPVITYSTTGVTDTYYGDSNGTTDVANSSLVGVYADNFSVPQSTESEYHYVLQKKSGDDAAHFYKVTTSTIKSKGNRAYLKLTSSAVDAPAKLMLINNPVETGIANVLDAENVSISAIYSTSGAKLSGMQKGMNIVKYSNGQVKKIMVK